MHKHLHEGVTIYYSSSHRKLPFTSPYLTTLIHVLKKEWAMKMCPNRMSSHIQSCSHLTPNLKPNGFITLLKCGLAFPLAEIPHGSHCWCQSWGVREAFCETSDECSVKSTVHTRCLNELLASLTPVFQGMGGDTLGMPPPKSWSTLQGDTGRRMPPRGALSSSGHAQMWETLGTSEMKTSSPALSNVDWDQSTWKKSST